MEGKAVISTVNGSTRLWRKPAAAMQRARLGFAGRVPAGGSQAQVWVAHRLSVQGVQH